MYGTTATDLEHLAQLQISGRTAAAARRTRLRRSQRRAAAVRARRLADATGR